MAVCARGLVLVFYVVFTLFFNFWGEKKKKMGRAVFQCRAWMITNYFFLYGLLDLTEIPVHNLSKLYELLINSFQLRNSQSFCTDNECITDCKYYTLFLPETFTR